MKKRCVQCWKDKPLAQFHGARGGIVTWCQECRDLYRSGGRCATRRTVLDRASDLRVLFVERSQAHKLEGIPASISPGWTCPKTCPHRDSGCFAEYGKLRYHWERVSEAGLSWHAFLSHIRSLPAGQIWRHNVAGDLVGASRLASKQPDINPALLLELAGANYGRRGFTFTHWPVASPTVRDAVRLANGVLGFTVNLSADSLAQADSLLALNVAPVAVVLPSKMIVRRSPAGARVIDCPGESKGLRCSQCQLCTCGDRKTIVAFRPHGQWWRRVDERAKGQGHGDHP